MPTPELLSSEEITEIYTCHKDVTDIQFNANSNADYSVLSAGVRSINIGDDDNILERALVFRCIRDNTLISSKSKKGKVAKYQLIRLKEEYRGRGFVSTFEGKAVEIYKNNNFSEIQLEAAWQGIFAWPHMGYRYADSKKAEEILYRLWKNFFISTYQKSFSLSEDEKDDIIFENQTFSMVPDKFKEGMGSWLLENRADATVSMYKVVA